MPKSNYSLSSLKILSFAWLYTALFYADRLFTNSSTPGGDAKRSIGYFDAAQNSSAYLPLWDPYSAMGRPSMADPEWLFYRLIAPVFNLVPREFYNISYNLAIFSLLLLLLLVLFNLARAVRLNNVFAGFFSIIFVCGGNTWSSVESGRINTLVITISALALLPLYKAWLVQKKPALSIGLVFLVALNIVFAGYYAFVGYLFFSFFVFGCQWEKLDDLRSAIKVTIIHSFNIGFAGLALSAMFVLPMLDLQLGNIVSRQGWGTNYNSLNLLSALRMVIPYYNELPNLTKVFPYISFLLVPGLVCLLFSFRLKMDRVLKSIVIVGLLYFLLSIGFLVPDSIFEKAYGQIPIINLIRWGSVYAQYAAVVVALLSCYGLSVLIKSKTRMIVIFAISGTITVGLMSTIGLISLADSDLFKVLVWTAVLVLLFTLGCVLIGLRRPSDIAIISILVFGLLLHMATPRSAFFANKSLVEMPRTNNVYEVAKLVSGKDGLLTGARQYCLIMHLCPTGGVPSVYGFNGFSMYFPEETRDVYRMVLGKEVEVGRPHWVRRTRCSDFSEIGMEIANIKLVYCHGNNRPPGIDWVRIGSLDNVSVWKNSSATSQFKLFHNVEEIGLDVDSARIEQLWVRDTLGLSKDFDAQKILSKAKGSSQIEIVAMNDDSIELAVESDEKAYLFGSIIFDEGWRAHVNSKRVTVHRAFNSFVAISVPSGRSVIRLNYSQKSWVNGKWISFLSLIAILMVVGHTYARRHNRIYSLI